MSDGVVGVLTVSLKLARAAVEADTQGRLSEARYLYGEAVKGLADFQSHRLSKHDAVESQRLLFLYRSRMKVIQDVLNGDAADGHHGGDAESEREVHPEIHFSRLPLLHRDLPPVTLDRPQDPRVVPYWLMSRIAASVRRGSRVTGSLFIPAEVWDVDNASLAGLSAKMQALGEVLAALRTFLRAFRGPPGPPPSHERTRAELDRLHARVQAVHQTLYSVFDDLVTPPAGTPIGEDKGALSKIGGAITTLRSTIARGAAVVTGLGVVARREVVSYSRLLVDTFERAEILGVWLCLALDLGCMAPAPTSNSETHGTAHARASWHAGLRPMSGGDESVRVVASPRSEVSRSITSLATLDTRSDKLRPWVTLLSESHLRNTLVSITACFQASVLPLVIDDVGKLTNHYMSRATWALRASSAASASVPAPVSAPGSAPVSAPDLAPT